jgi:hypothetical protein
VVTLVQDGLRHDASHQGFVPTGALSWEQMERLEAAERARASGKYETLDEMRAVLHHV